MGLREAAPILLTVYMISPWMYLFINFSFCHSVFLGLGMLRVMASELL